MVLAGHEEELQLTACEFGKNIALAWQASNELKLFIKCTESYKHSVNMFAAFQLRSAPIILHVENDEESLESPFVQGEEGSTHIHYKKCIPSSQMDMESRRQKNKLLFTLKKSSGNFEIF